MMNRFFVLIIAMGLLAACNGGTATSTTQLPDPGDHALDYLLSNGEKRLREVEGQAMTMTTRDEITAKANALVNDALDEYSLTMETAYAATRRDTALAGDTNGAKGSALSAKLFEDTAQDHEGRLGRLQKSMQAYAGRVQRGEVQFDRTILEQMNAQQRGDLRDWLAPEAAVKLQQRHPDLFPKETVSQRLRRARDRAAGLVGNACQALPRSAEQVLVSRAEAKVVFDCVGDCSAKNYASCAACVARGVQETVKAINDFQDCWKKTGWWLPRIGCTFALVFVLA